MKLFLFFFLSLAFSKENALSFSSSEFGTAKKFIHHLAKSLLENQPRLKSDSESSYISSMFFIDDNGYLRFLWVFIGPFKKLTNKISESLPFGLEPVSHPLEMHNFGASNSSSGFNAASPFNNSGAGQLGNQPVGSGTVAVNQHDFLNENFLNDLASSQTPLDIPLIAPTQQQLDMMQVRFFFDSKI